MIAKVIRYALQPLALCFVLGLWIANPDTPELYVLLLVGTQILLGLLEAWLPARPEWRQSASEKSLLVLIAFITASLAFAIGMLYANVLAEPLQQLREAAGLDVWPHHWPLAVQALMVFFASEFLWYWTHRAEHRWSFVWRLSGHGAHHSFKRLGAINFGANHPLEMFFLVLPGALIELLFGVGIAVAIATTLVGVQASFAHANLNFNTRIIGWLFTTNRYHIHHHSMVLAESNTNYGCAAIVWDRLFGTFADANTQETGTGATEPSLWQKIIMPVKQPVDTAIAPN